MAGVLCIEHGISNKLPQLNLQSGAEVYSHFSKHLLSSRLHVEKLTEASSGSILPRGNFASPGTHTVTCSFLLWESVMRHPWCRLILQVKEGSLGGSLEQPMR